MPIRNPFRRAGVTPGVDPSYVNGGRPRSRNGAAAQSEGSPVLEPKPLSILSIKSGRSSEPDEFKMSVLNDSGVYLPPSPPPERHGLWSRWHGSNASSNHRSLLCENEPFSISRESFESYRRSFDISARSPVAPPDVLTPRISMDSRAARLSRARVSESRLGGEPSVEDDGFEDVGLNDEVKPKRRSLFSMFGDASDSNASSASSGGSHHHGFSFTGRKRAHSGQGAELHPIAEPARSGPSEIKARD